MRNQQNNNLVGQKFGRLTVLRRGEDEIDAKSGKHKSRYWCQCDCGSKEKLIRGASLTNKRVQSCGCLLSETASKTMKKYRNSVVNKNDFIIDSDIAYLIPSNTNNKVLIDADDVDKVSKIYWSENEYGYCCGDYNGKSIRLHEYIMDSFPGFVVDHKNGDKRNNKKSNLRQTLQALNVKNRLRGNSLNGIKKTKEGYEVTITCNKSKIFVGAYKAYEEAVLNRFKAEIELYGEYSTRDNFGYDELKEKALEYFKPVHKMYMLNKEDFINWGNQNCYFNDSTGKFTDDENDLTMVQFYMKHSRMEVFYKYLDNVVCFGYFGTKLIDKDDTCLKRILFGNLLL